MRCGIFFSPLRQFSEGYLNSNDHSRYLSRDREFIAGKLPLYVGSVEEEFLTPAMPELCYVAARRKTPIRLIGRAGLGAQR